VNEIPNALAMHEDDFEDMYGFQKMSKTSELIFFCRVSGCVVSLHPVHPHHHHCIVLHFCSLVVARRLLQRSLISKVSRV
jgi:hypothetical protein